MKTYKKQIRAVAYEVAIFRVRTKEYPWYDEDDFPSNIEEIIKADNPFGGWYYYDIEERFIEIN